MEAGRAQRDDSPGHARSGDRSREDLASVAEVQAAIAGAVERISRAGKPCGIFALSPEDARQWLAKGVCFVSVGTDLGLLARGARELRGAIR